MANEVEVKIDVETKKAINDLNKFFNKVDSSTKKTTKNVSDFDATLGKMGKTLALAGVAAGAAAAAGLGLLAKASLDSAARIETLSTQLETLTGSAANAKRLISDLATFAAATPFDLPGITDAAKKLLAFGVAQDDIVDKLQFLGDVSAASGANIGELTLIFGQVAAAGKLTGERLLQLQERAIPIGPALAKSMGVAESSIKDLVTAGKVSFTEFEKAFDSLNNEGEQFFKGMERQSKTFDGVMSTLDDSFDMLLATIGDEFLPIAKEFAIALTEGITNIDEAIKRNPGIIQFFADVADVLVVTPSKFWLDLIAGDTGLSNTSQEIEALETQISFLNEKMKTMSTENTWDPITKSFTNGQVAIDATTLKILELEGRLQSLRATLNTEQETTGGSAKPVGGLSPEQQARIDAEAETQATLSQIKEEARLLEEEQKLLLKEAAGVATEEDLQSLRDLEIAKTQIALDGELAKAKLIKDKDVKNRKEKEIEAKKDLLFLKAKNKIELDEAKRAKLMETQIFNSRLQASQTFLQAGLNMSKEGSKAQKAIQTTTALVSTYTAAAQALASPPGPPFTLPLVAATVALGLSNVAKINGLSFQDGGIVPGTSFAGDRVNARVNSGELILNRSQQANIAEQLTGGGNNSEQLNAILSQPIVVEIDGVEIARATRNAVRDGFAIA